jgi:hypothetical protein
MVLFSVIIASAGWTQKVPFKVLYNHDGTHMQTCVHPWREKGESFSEKMLVKSIEELAGKGIEAVTFNPGNGCVPWWQSDIYPNHYQWFMQRTGKQPSSYGKYIINGGDMVKVFVDTCREQDLIPMITLRLKDEHGVGSMDTEWVSKFFYRNQHLRLDPRPGAVFGYRGLSWMYPEVPAERLRIIRELSENYDIDGIELDFMRFFPFFDLELTGYAQRRQIMHDFIAQVRKILDETSKKGQRRYLSIRVPNRIEEYKRLGIDLGYIDQQGWVDIINISPSYCSQVENELKLFRSWAPNTSIFFEMTHCVTRGPCLSWGRPGMGGDGYPVRFTTPQKYITMANTAWNRDVDGLSLFNVIYTRPGNRPDGQVHGGTYNPGDPPWDVFKKLTDIQWLKKQPQHYWINWWWKTGYHGRQFQLPVTFKNHDEHTFKLDIVPPEPTVKEGCLRLMTTEGTPGLGWEVWINGNKLAVTKNVSEPFEDPYGGYMGDPVQYYAFKVKPEFVKNGQNDIRVRLADGPLAEEFTTEIMYIDFALYPEN